MIAIGILIVIIGAVIIYWNIPYLPYKVQFDKQMESREAGIDYTVEVCTREDIASLPKPLQKYCAYIGMENFPKYQVVNTAFKNTNFVFDDKSNL